MALISNPKNPSVKSVFGRVKAQTVRDEIDVALRSGKSVYLPIPGTSAIVRIEPLTTSTPIEFANSFEETITRPGTECVRVTVTAAERSTFRPIIGSQRPHLVQTGEGFQDMGFTPIDRVRVVTHRLKDESGPCTQVEIEGVYNLETYGQVTSGVLRVPLELWKSRSICYDVSRIGVGDDSELAKQFRAQARVHRSSMRDRVSVFGYEPTPINCARLDDGTYDLKTIDGKLYSVVVTAGWVEFLDHSTVEPGQAPRFRSATALHLQPDETLLFSTVALPDGSGSLPVGEEIRTAAVTAVARRTTDGPVRHWLHAEAEASIDRMWRQHLTAPHRSPITGPGVDSPGADGPREL